MIEGVWLLFVVAPLVLFLTPGQGMIPWMSRSIAQGAVADVATAAPHPGLSIFARGLRLALEHRA